MPLLAVETIDPELLEMLPDFRRRTRWFLRHRPDLAALVPRVTSEREWACGGCWRWSAATDCGKC